MAYQSLYRKYRPQTFADVMGQGHVVRTLQNAIASGRVAHGYLFTGTRGTAKTTIARLLAKALNCESATHPVTEPCNQCSACKTITAGGSIDVIEMDAASHRGVADIEEVRKSVGYGPMELRYKVFIIDEAHQLSSDAKDAFLKTLEEPPENVVFILATTEPQAIPITIRSRCQQFDFKRGSLAEIASRLRFVLDKEGVTYTPEAVNLVARGAEGSYRDSLSLLEQVLAFAPQQISANDVVTVLGTLDTDSLARVTEAVANRDAATTFALAGQLLDAGKEARTLLRTLSAHFRDLLLVKVGGPAVATELTPDEVLRLQQQAQAFTAQQMLKAVDVLNEAQGETRWNNQHRLLVELAFLKLMTIGEAPDAPLSVAPIIFSSGPPEPLTITPIPAPEYRTAAVPVNGHAVAEVVIPPPPVVSIDPEPVPEIVTPEIEETLIEEALEGSYFADETASDDEIELEEVLPLLVTITPPEPTNIDLFAEETEEPTEPVAEATHSGPSLFDDDEPAPPAVVATPKPTVAPTTVETLSPAEPVANPFGLFDEEEVGAGLPAPEPFRQGAEAQAEIDVPQAFEEPEIVSFRTAEPEPVVEEEIDDANQVTIDDVYRAWPRFLMDARRLSKRTEIMMASAHPERVYRNTVEIVFPGRFQYDMMSTPKAQEFVRKLFARCLGVPKLGVKFVLSEAAPPPPPRSEKKQKVEFDPLAAIDALDTENAAFRQPAYEQIEVPPSTYRAPAPTPSVPPARFATASRRAESHENERPYHNANSRRFDGEPSEDAPLIDHPALSHPLVQEILQIFGGEIVMD